MASDMPLFSVVIPTFNREALVGATLQSVFEQEFDDWELIIVDDGSTDRTLDVVAGFSAKQPGRLRLLNQDHHGCAAARNRGADAASGEYLAFLDSDDLWFPWTLRLLAEQIEAHDRPTMVCLALHNFHDEGQIAQITESAPELGVGRDLFEGGLRNDFALGVAHTVCRREAYQRVGGCPELDINGTDSDVLLKMGVDPGFVRFTAPPLLAYRQHEGSTTVNADKSHASAIMLMDHERRGLYPGGPARRADRLGQVLIRVRAISALCVNVGRSELGWDLYRKAFGWNLQTFRFRYLFGFPALALWRRVTGPSGAYKQ